MAARPPVIRLAVYGSPVAHSLSPLIHRRFGRQCGLEVDYSAIEATAEDFPARLRELERDGGRGCNVTVPFKHAAWTLAARRSEAAERARAANTLFFEAPDDWYADNTDGRGLVDDLCGPLGRDLGNARVCLLGAGGAAAGVLAALLRSGCKRLVLANRTLDRARELAARHRDLGPVEVRPLTEIGAGAPFELMINSTSMGHGDRAPPLSADWMAPGGLCYDLNYGRAAEPLRSACSREGIAYSDGLGMLVAQAARSFELWTGQRPDAEPVLAKLREEGT